ncbi:MAG TPA: GIY-YIG nuclease family protein [Gammaproteobacteria bacterium]|jgi:putative endonuclease
MNLAQGWYVYVIECESGAWYTGITNDLERRFQAHVDGKGAKFMRMDRPKRIVAARPCESKGEALKSEAALKTLARPAKRAWIEENAWLRKDAG